MTSSKNSEERYFPELHIHILKEQAERWIKKFNDSPIKRILLYKFSSPYEGEMADHLGEKFKSFPHIYAIVFEVNAEDKTVNMLIEDRIEDLMRYDRQKIGGRRSLETYERLLDATEPNSRNPYEKRYRHFITEDFKRIYNPPVKDINPYRKDWYFTLKFENTELNENIKTDEPFITLASPLEKVLDRAPAAVDTAENKTPQPQVESPKEKLIQAQTPTPEKQADDSIPVISFYKKGDFWQIGKEGNEAYLKHLKGYELIQFLIRNENVSYDPMTLYHLGAVPEELKHLVSSSQAKYNKKTFAQVKEEIEKLAEKLEGTSDIVEKEEIQEKIEKGEKYLNSSRYLFSISDRCRRNARELIKRAIEKLHKEAEKESALSPLKKYLTIKGTPKTIKIGFDSFYKPNPSDSVKWKLTPDQQNP
jgi:hypothetical protein